MNIKNEIAKTPESNYKKGRGGWTPGLISLHICEGSYNGSISWFQNSKSGVSAHFVVSAKGEVTQCVKIEDTAFVNGTTISTSTDSRYFGNSTNGIVKQRKTNANNYTVGIEFEGFAKNGICTMTAEQKSTAIELIAFIIDYTKKKYGTNIPIDRSRICGHYEITPQTKPFCGRGFPYDDIIKGVQMILTK